MLLYVILFVEQRTEHGRIEPSNILFSVCDLYPQLGLIVTQCSIKEKRMLSFNLFLDLLKTGVFTLETFLCKGSIVQGK